MIQTSHHVLDVYIHLSQFCFEAPTLTWTLRKFDFSLFCNITHILLVLHRALAHASYHVLHKSPGAEATAPSIHRLLFNDLHESLFESKAHSLLKAMLNYFVFLFGW